MPQGRYRAFINDTVKPMLPESQRDKHNWHSAPCCWIEIERPDGTHVLDMKGGGDRLREWALDEFPASDPANDRIRALAGREPNAFTDEFFNCVDPGTVGMHRGATSNNNPGAQR